MSLKDLTKDKHTEAERTNFMRAALKGRMTDEVWADYTYQKSIFYDSIENVARYEKLTVDCLDIERAIKLYLDAKEMCGNSFPRINKVTIEYCRYLLDLVGQPDKIMAHLYVWHMGDMHGGQIIRKLLPFPHRNLDFNDVEKLKVTIRSKLNDSMADEANIAFAWGIRLMKEYDAALPLPVEE